MIYEVIVLNYYLLLYKYDTKTSHLLTFYYFCDENKD